MAGKSNGPVISIKPEFKNNKGIHAHELEHVKQWWMWMLLSGLGAACLFLAGEVYWFFVFLPGIAMHSLLYSMVTPYRKWSEVAAYKVQAEYGTDDKAFLARALTTYGLGITESEALKLLEAK